MDSTGAVAAALTTPFDVAKTRLMTQKITDSVCSKTGLTTYAKPHYDDVMIGTLRKIYAEEGFRALWSGIVPRTIWIGMGGFIFFGAYEGSKKFLTQGGCCSSLSTNKSEKKDQDDVI